MTFKMLNNNYTEISIMMYVEHPDDNNNLKGKNVSLLDIAKVLEDTLFNEYSFSTSNLYDNKPDKLLIDRLGINTHNTNCTFTNFNFLPNKDIIENFMRNHTISNYTNNYTYGENDTKYIDSYSINNLFSIISEILRETSDNMHKVFQVRYIGHSSKADCIEFRLNLEKLYEYLPADYKCNYPSDVHLAYSLMLMWCANTIYAWLNDLRLIDDDSCIFSSIPVSNIGLDYTAELERFIGNNKDVKQNLVNVVLNTLFNVCNCAICSKLKCSCTIALPCSTLNLFNELTQLSNDNHFYTTKNNDHSFELVVYDSKFIPECRKYLSCMTPDIPVIMIPDESGSIIKSNQITNPDIRLTVKEDKEYKNVIHCNIEVNNRIGFHNLIIGLNNNINNDDNKAFLNIVKNSSDDEFEMNNIYACTLVFSFMDFPSNLAILLLCSYCLYNPNVKYIEKYSKCMNLVPKMFYDDKSDYQPIIEEIFYLYKSQVESFYDINKIEEIDISLKKVFKCAPHNRYITIMEGIKCKTLREFKQCIKETFKDLRNTNDLEKNFAKAYKILQKVLSSSKHINIIDELIKYAQGIISC